MQRDIRAPGDLPAATTLATLQPSAWRALTDVVEHAWSMTDAELLALAITRSAQLDGVAELADHVLPPASSASAAQARRDVREWHRAPGFGPRERAALAFVEQCRVDPNGVADADVTALAEHMDAAQLLAFASAVYVVDAQLRVLAAAGQLLGREQP